MLQVLICCYVDIYTREYSSLDSLPTTILYILPLSFFELEC